MNSSDLFFAISLCGSLVISPIYSKIENVKFKKNFGCFLGIIITVAITQTDVIYNLIAIISTFLIIKFSPK